MSPPPRPAVRWQHGRAAPRPDCHGHRSRLPKSPKFWAGRGTPRPQVRLFLHSGSPGSPWAVRFIWRLAPTEEQCDSSPCHHAHLPAPCSCLRHTPLPGARCGPQSGCCPISDRSLKDLIPQSQLFTPQWCCPSALPRCPIAIGELSKSPSRNFTGFGTHLGWRDTDTFHSFRIKEEGGSR